MKTAVSIPDELFGRAERLARKMNVSRSRLFSSALTEYLARHAGEEITEALNASLDEIGEESDPFVREAARRTLESSVW